MSKQPDEVAPDPLVVERYQQILATEPGSKVFAPLADAYRKMGMLKEALATCKEGVRKHPDFAGGRIALARIFLESNQLDSAISELEKVKAIAPDNLAALSLLSDSYLRHRRLREALGSYKALLFLSPTNIRAQNAVKKLESLTAADFEDEELFQMRPLASVNEQLSKKPAGKSKPKKSEPVDQTELKRRQLDRVISLADAFFARNENEKANAILNEGEKELGNHPEIVKRLKILHQKHLDQIRPPTRGSELVPPPSRPNGRQKNIAILKNLLVKFQQIQAENSKDELEF